MFHKIKELWLFEKKDANFSNFSWGSTFVNYFQGRPQLIALGLFFLVVLGVISFMQLRLNGFSAIDSSSIVVTTEVPGANPETVYAKVTTPLEQSLSGLGGLKFVDSTSTAGMSTLVLKFADDVDVSTVVKDVSNRITSARFKEEARPSKVNVSDIDTAPFLIAISGGTDLLSLRKQADQFSEKVLSIQGVSAFTDISGIEEKIYIDLPPQYLLPDVVEQIELAGMGNKLGQAIIDGKQISVVTNTELISLDSVRNIQITLPDGPQKLLSELAQVYLGADADGGVHRVGYLDKANNQFKIQPAVLFAVQLNNKADLFEVNEKLKDLVQEMSTNKDFDFVIVANRADLEDQQLDQLISGVIGGKWGDGNPLGYVGFLFGGLWLLIIMVFLLLDYKTALISFLSLPLSLLFTFIVLNIFGVELNTVVLFFIVLGSGLAVGPSIIVLESIRQALDLGMRGKQAALGGIRIAGPRLFISLVSLLIALIPFFLVGGPLENIAGVMLWTILPTITASYLIALVVSSWLGVKYLSRESSMSVNKQTDVYIDWPLVRWLVRFYKNISRSKAAQIVLVSVALVGPIILAVFLFSRGAVRYTEYNQLQDSGSVELSIPLQSNLTQRNLLITATDAESILKKYANVINSFYYSGLDVTSGNMEIIVVLVPENDRTGGGKDLARQMQNDLQEKFGANAKATTPASGDVSSSDSFAVRIFGDNPLKLEDQSKQLSMQLDSYDEVDFVKADNNQKYTELELNVDPARAQERGLSSQVIFAQIAGYLREKVLYQVSGTEAILRLPQDTKPLSREAFLASVVYGSGGPVPLREVASVSEQVTPNVVRSYNGKRYTEINARLKDERSVVVIQQKINDWIRQNREVLGESSITYVDRFGDDRTKQSSQELLLVMLFVVLFSYVCFAVFFKSLINPFVIVLGLPSILFGALSSVIIFSEGRFGNFEFIGVVVVVGLFQNIVATLIDDANQRLKTGKEKYEAISLAIQSQIKIVVLILTVVSALLLPIAVFSTFWRELTMVVVFGSLSSGAIALLVTPVLYVWLVKDGKGKDGSFPQFPLIGAVNGQKEPTTLPPNLSF